MILDEALVRISNDGGMVAWYDVDAVKEETKLFVMEMEGSSITRGEVIEAKDKVHAEVIGRRVIEENCPWFKFVRVRDMEKEDFTKRGF